ncbi:MAG: ABC transporter ATP-binding protein [Firmicutes bacterium]|nr:ABC transporter ATP-binding protein [Bacillota bacterium]
MIEVKDLRKQYGAHTALDSLSFSVEDNEIFGFLGPNGAGKSTTMNIITGYLAPTSGTVSIDGHDIIEDPVGAKRLIGYLPEIPPLYMEMTPREYLKFVAEARGVKKTDIRSEIDRVMEKVAITDVSDRLIKTLSKGYRQRVGMAEAIIGDPKIIIMDEPTVGLDPLQIIEFREMIRELGKDHTVILSSHILAEVSEICHKIMIIVKGRLVAIDTPENLAKAIGGDSENMSLEDIFLNFVEKEGERLADDL